MSIELYLRVKFLGQYNIFIIVLFVLMRLMFKYNLNVTLNIYILLMAKMNSSYFKHSGKMVRKVN